MDVKLLVMFHVEHGMALEPVKGIRPHLVLIWGTWSYFALLQ